MSALPAANFVNAADQRLAADDSPWSWFSATQIATLFEGEYEAAKKARQRWTAALPECQRRRDDDESPWMVRGDALKDEERVQDMLARIATLHRAPKEVLQRGGDTLQRELAERRRVAVIDAWTALGRAKWTEAAIRHYNAMCLEDIQKFNLPTNRRSIMRRYAQVKRDQATDRRFKSGRKQKPRDPRLLAMVNTVTLIEKGSERSAHAAQVAYAAELGIPALTYDAVRKHCSGEGEGAISGREWKLAREGKDALVADIPCVIRGNSSQDFLGWVAMDGTQMSFTVERITGEGEVKTIQPTLLLFVDFCTRMILGFYFALNERWEESLVPLSDICAAGHIPVILYHDSGGAFVKAFGSSWQDKVSFFMGGAGIKGVSKIVNQAQSGGLIEKLNQTVQNDWMRPFMRTLNGQPTTREAAKASLSEWIDGIYHERAHHGEGMNGLSPRQKRDEWMRRKLAADPDFSLPVIDRETLDYLSGVMVGPCALGRNGVRYNKQIYGHFNDAYDRLVASGRTEKVWLRLDARDWSFGVLCEEDRTPIIDELTQQPICVSDKRLQGSTPEEIREAIAFQARVKKATREAMAGREFLLSTRGQQVQQIRAKHGRAMREAEHAQRGAPPAPAVRISGGNVRTAAHQVADQRDRYQAAATSPAAAKVRNHADALLETHAAAIDRAASRAAADAADAAYQKERNAHLERVFQEAMEAQDREQMEASAEPASFPYRLGGGAA